MTEHNLTKTCFFETGTYYEVTICPEDKCQFFRHTNRLGKFKSWFYQNITSQFEGKVKYYLRLELSEPKQVGNRVLGPRLHAHGFFEFSKNSDICKFLLYSVPNLARNCIVEFDSCNDMSIWKAYCDKQKEVINVLYTNYNVTQNGNIYDFTDEKEVEAEEDEFAENTDSSDDIF